MSISLDKINFCYQYPPPKTGTTSRWKPYQVPSASAHSPHRTCLLPSEPGVSTVSAPTRSGAAETTQSSTISPGGSTMGIRNEFDVGIEGMTLVEHSSNVSEKGPGTRQACGFLDETAKDISWSLSASSSGAMCNLRWIRFISLLILNAFQLPRQSQHKSRQATAIATKTRIIKQLFWMISRRSSRRSRRPS